MGHGVKQWLKFDFFGSLEKKPFRKIFIIPLFLYGVSKLVTPHCRVKHSHTFFLKTSLTLSTAGYIDENGSTILSGYILTLHFNFKPFDLKEIDIMVSFPDSYPQEVKSSIYTTCSVFRQHSKCLRWNSSLSPWYISLDFHIGYTTGPGSATSDGKVKACAVYFNILNV